MKRSPHDSAAAEYIDALHLPERRTHLRHQPHSIVYVELDEGNGGIALNLSETGLSVQSVMPMVDDFLSRLRFQLSESKEWIEASAQVVWANESRKLLGLRFMDLPEASRGQIRKWLEREDLPNKEMDGLQILSEGLEGRAAPPPISMAVMPAPPPPMMDAPVLTFSEALAERVPAPEADVRAGAPLSVAAAMDAAETTGTGTPAATLSGPIPSEEPKPSASFQPATSFQPEVFRSTIRSGDLPNRRIIAIFFLFLATVSLATGWAVGRGAFAGGIQTLRKVVFRDGTAGVAVAPIPGHLVPQEHISKIEIINAASERWTIPLTASPLGAAAQTRRDSSASLPSPGHAKAVPFKTWVLSAPLQPRSRGADSDATGPPSAGPSIEPPQGALPAAEQPELSAPPPPKQSVVKHAELIRAVNPAYPALALTQRIEGVVKMRVTITASGRVGDIRVISGPIPLTDAAVKAVSQWIYSPTLIGGKPADSDMDVSITFRLP